MSTVLGVSAYYHDSAAALLIDGRVVACIQEERLSRIKHDAALPLRAIDACLDEGGLAAGELDAVVYYENPYAKLERVLLSQLRNFPRSWRQFPRAMRSQLGSKLWVLDQLVEALGLPRSRARFVDHHASHAASAFYASPYERAAVLVTDAVGEDDTTSLWHGDADGLRRIGSIPYPNSLGLLYAALTAWLGFEVNEGEYKVMGLASFGTPRFRQEFEQLIRLDPSGGFELALGPFGHFVDHRVGFGAGLERLLGPRRPSGVPWDLSAERDRRYADVAATLQRVTEEALVGLAARARRETGCDALCMAGGVALNAVANARIQREAGFERVFVQPAAGDAGGALGAAILGALEEGDPRPAPLTSCALGQTIDPARALETARALGLEPIRVDDPPAEVARRLEDGAVVACSSGRFEWGPRALGQRSILASPRDPRVRERINRTVKRREPFRPFAPAVLSERYSTWFQEQENDMTPFMTTVVGVRPEGRRALGAVTHADGSARVQTVTADSSPELHAVLSALERGGAAPVVLNTSANLGGEPIVAGAEDALAFFLRTPVDAALIGDLLFERRLR